MLLSTKNSSYSAVYTVPFGTFSGTVLARYPLCHYQWPIKVAAGKISKCVSTFVFARSSYSLSCHGRAKLMFRKLCSIIRSSRAHWTKSVLAMGHELFGNRTFVAGGADVLFVATFALVSCSQLITAYVYNTVSTYLCAFKYVVLRIIRLHIWGHRAVRQLVGLLHTDNVCREHARLHKDVQEQVSHKALFQKASSTWLSPRANWLWCCNYWKVCIPLLLVNLQCYLLRYKYTYLC